MSNKRYWLVSISIHAVPILGILFLSIFSKPDQKKELVKFELIEEKPLNEPVNELSESDLKESEPEASDILTKKSQETTAPQKAEQMPERVFGLDSDALTNESETASESAVALKKGNTLNKAQDDKKLLSDEDLPVPKPEFLVDRMPDLVFKAPLEYPEEAKSKGIEATVNLKVLIDEQGRVRRVLLLNDPGFGLGAAAQKSMYKYKFSPAQIAGQAIAVEIRYAYEFSLQ